MNPLIQLRTPILPLIAFALLQSVEAAPDPAPPPGANTRDGAGAMAHITTGQFNSAFGTNALNKLTIGNNNAAQGNSALFGNTSGSGNVALGSIALRLNTVGKRNTAIGYAALSSFNPPIGSDDAEFGNTAVGWKALSNTSGSGAVSFGGNVAVGGFALTSNTTGNENVAIGFQALVKNTTASDNVAVGTLALLNNTIGSGNTANGTFALVQNTIGASNVANGAFALVSNESGVANVAVGGSALNDNTTGNNNTAVGNNAGGNITGNGNVCIGQGVVGVAGESNTTRIRNVYASVATTRAVYVTSSNKIGTLASSRRVKDDIQPMGKASEAILALKPVTFRYKKQIEPNGAIMFGLIAEEVEQVAPDLVTRNDKGEAETVRYEAVNAMLLNEFLKEHRAVQEQQKEIDALKAELKEQRALIQKVSDKVDLSRPTPQVAENNR
jgi:hypothetical protein